MRKCDVIITVHCEIFVPIEKIYEQCVGSEAPTTNWTLINPVWTVFVMPCIQAKVRNL